MSQPSFLKFALAGIASFALFTINSSAQITPVFTSSPTPNSPTLAPFSVSVEVPSFNDSLGTLEGIVLGLTLYGSNSVDVINISMGAQNFTNATASIPITVNGPQGLTLTVDPTAGPFTGVATPGPGSQTIGPAGTTLSTSGFVSFLPSSSTIDFNSNDVGSTVDIPLDFLVGNGTYSGLGSPVLFFGGQADAYAVATIQYLYLNCGCDPVPEPSTSGLLVTALGGLMVGGYFLRRREAKA